MGRRNRSTTKVASTLIDAMWRQVTQRARPGAHQGGLRRGDPHQRRVPRVRRRVVAGARRRHGARLAARPRPARARQRGRPRRRVGAAALEVVGRRASVDDMALLDELRYLLGDPPIVNTGSVDDEYLAVEDASLQEVFTASDREYAGPRGWTPPTNRVEDDGFAHVLVDEAQDLTPMQWRMVGRRGRGATWTIVGDPAQSSWPVPSEAAAVASSRGARRQAAARLPPLHQLPQLRGDLRVRGRVRRPGRPRRRPARRGPLDRCRPGRAPGGRPRVGGARARSASWPARWRARSAWSCRWPGSARSPAGSRRGPSSPTRSVRRTRGSSYSPGWTPRASSSTASSWSSRRRSRTSPPTGRSTLYVVYTRATQRMVTLTAT